ncbi:AAC(3) family N-acetyltransferase [Streptomyces turgidiscabies]|uniref:AAC(3) family N-acetyltransferase n=1 Tax=Streptomyces TaxID=1883 RepID=UPI0002F8E5C9|nr:MULTISPECIES: AAC(3) family N-acetyltransferase [Streptomyces]MDX3495289.1 AAC(3) family N-acetyltransferase [Streptomyces turgidiscabies]GAQ69976.1 SPBc2 prophage-derived aminoglycoside N(3')-acetyltransferase-like protein YokD [Streptomyces turgidiscabies]
MHSALSTVGSVANGAETMVSALSEVLGPSGTLVMRTSTPHDARASTSSSAQCTAPVFGVGVLAETVRTRSAALHSAHPRSAFTALGAQADYITSDPSPGCSLGQDSPLGRQEKLDARVLLMGVGFEAFTAFHLAEYRITSRLTGPHVSAETLLGSSPFAAVGASYEATGAVRSGRVGHAHCRLFDLADAVASAVGQLTGRAAEGAPTRTARRQ